jgi:hypothetical protein
MRFGPGRARIALVAAIAFVTTSGFPVISHAQRSAPPVAVGTRVRVTSPALGDAPAIATVLGQSGDTFAIRPEGSTDSVALSTANITALDVSAGSHTRILKAMGVGFLVGVATGAVAGAATYRKCSGDCEVVLPDSRSFDAFVGGVMGAVIGPIVGAGVGALWRTEDWTPVPLDPRRSSLRLRISPAGSRGVGLSVTF